MVNDDHPETVRTEFMIFDFPCAEVQVGLTSQTSAATPDTMGVALEVPLISAITGLGRGAWSRVGDLRSDPHVGKPVRYVGRSEELPLHSERLRMMAAFWPPVEPVQTRMWRKFA